MITPWYEGYEIKVNSGPYFKYDVERKGKHLAYTCTYWGAKWIIRRDVKQRKWVARKNARMNPMGRCSLCGQEQP